MNLKNLLEAMASQLEAHAGLREMDGDMQPSDAWSVELTGTAQALRDAAARVNPEVSVKAGEPD